MKPSQLIGAGGRERIAAAVSAAERGTTGEIVVAIVRGCDEYGAAGWRLGVLLAALTFLALALFAPPLPMTAYLAAQLAVLAVGHTVARFDEVRRLLVSEAMMEACAERAAAATFVRLGLADTPHRTGILIFVALLEHRVVVLADRGIDEALGGEENWTEIVALVLDGIERGGMVDGIVAAVGRCGEILENVLPAGADDSNQIHLSLVIEDEMPR